MHKSYLRCPMCGGTKHIFKLERSLFEDSPLIFENIFCAKKSCPFGVTGYGYDPNELAHTSKSKRENWRKTYWNAGVASVVFKKPEDFYDV